MKSKQCIFFGLEEDFEPILVNIEKHFDISYIEMGLFDNKEINKYFSFVDIPSFCYTKSESWISGNNRYMIIERKSDVAMREVPQKKGNNKYAIDLLMNPNGIEFSPSGIYLKMDNVLIGGRIGITSEHIFANDLYKVFEKQIKSDFKKIKSFYVGKNAKQKLYEGWRLVTDVNSPKEYDLSI